MVKGDRNCPQYHPSLLWGAPRPSWGEVPTPLETTEVCPLSFAAVDRDICRVPKTWLVDKLFGMRREGNLLV